MMFKFLLGLVVVIATVFGLYMVLTPGEKLVNAAKRGAMGLPMPARGTIWFKLLVGFYRVLGVVAFLFAVFVVVMAVIKNGQ